VFTLEQAAQHYKDYERFYRIFVFRFSYVIKCLPLPRSFLLLFLLGCGAVCYLLSSKFIRHLSAINILYPPFTVRLLLQYKHT